MKVDDLFDLSLRELLEDYSVVFSNECSYFYGICRNDDAEKIDDTYDLEDYVSLSFEPVIWWLMEYESDDEVMSLEKLMKICEDNGFEKKTVESV